MTRILALLTLITLALTAARPAAAQESFQPIPPAEAPRYHFNFPRNFFPSPETEKGDRKAFLQRSCSGKVVA